MLIKFIFLLILSSQIYADSVLKKIYYIDSDEINISSIITNIKEDVNLFNIGHNKYKTKIKSKELIQILKMHGHSSFTANSRYIQFIKKSPIDLSKIRNSIEKFYKECYSNIDIKNITIMPRGYIKSLPKEYIIHIPPKNNLSNNGTIYIKTYTNKKIFFDYNIYAKLSVYVTRKKIKRDVELSPINTIKKSIILEKFRALPIQELEKGTFQTKRHIKQNKILTIRDIETLNIVKRNSNINVSLNNKEISITFSAKALQDGKLNDIITVQKLNGKRIKVRVIGKNRAEIR